MNQKDLILGAQKAMNAQGERLTEDGVCGPITTATMQKYTLAGMVLERNPVPVPVVPSGEFFGAIWVGGHLNMLGKTETDPVLVALLAPNWQNLDGCHGIKDLSGKDHAWCANDVDFDFRKYNIPTPNSGLASSYGNWAESCPHWFGAILPIEHDSGGRHVCRFLYWIDKANGICATLDGNRGNKFAVNRTNISGKNGADHVKTTPRWPTGWPAGQEVSMADVLAAYPMLKVGGAGSSTT